MNIRVNQKIIYGAIHTVQKISANKNLSDIANGILIEADNNMVNITSASMDIIVETKFRCQILRKGSAVLDGKLLLNLIRNIPADEEISIVSDGSKTTVKCDGVTFDLNSKEKNIYPNIVQNCAQEIFEINASTLKTMVRQVVFSTVENDFINNINGVLLSIDENGFSLVYLDRCRLALKKAQYSLRKNINVIIPQRNLVELSKIIDTYMGEIEARIYENIIVFNFENITFTSKLLQGSFIDYKKIISKELKTKITISKKKIQESLERVTLFTNDNKVSGVKFSIVPDGVLVTTNSKIGGIEEKINCEVHGEVLDVAFNTKYILDGLRGIDDEFVNMYFTSKVGPCSIKNINDDSYLYVVVPVNFK